MEFVERSAVQDTMTSIIITILTMSMKTKGFKKGKRVLTFGQRYREGGKCGRVKFNFARIKHCSIEHNFCLSKTNQTDFYLDTFLLFFWS